MPLRYSPGTTWPSMSSSSRPCTSARREIAPQSAALRQTAACRTLTTLEFSTGTAENRFQILPVRLRRRNGVDNLRHSGSIRTKGSRGGDPRLLRPNNGPATRPHIGERPRASRIVQALGLDQPSINTIAQQARQLKLSEKL